MIILKNVEQINSRLNNVFKLSEPFENDDYAFINQILPEEEILQKVSQTGMILGKESVIEELSLLIFQLKNYIPALCNLTNMFLLSKNYDAVYHFTTRLFITRIGNISYQSSGSYTYTERFFDRFIEIVKNCNISKEHYIPFILEIFKSERVGGLAQWKAPALEFMKSFYAEHEEWVVEYLKNDPRKFEMMSLLCQFNTQRGLALSLEYFATSSKDEDKFLELFKQNKKEVILFIDQKLNSASEQTLAKFAKILLAMDKDQDAKSRLEEIFKRSNNLDLRNTISQTIGISENASYKNEKQFLLAVRRTIKQPKNSIVGIDMSAFDLHFKSGFKLDNACYTFLIDIFEQDSNLLNLIRYASLDQVFDQQSLEQFLQQVFDAVFFKKDLLNHKWAVRMLALLAKNNSLENKLFHFAHMFFEEGKIEEGKYLLDCLIASKKAKVFDVICALWHTQNFLPFRDQVLNAYAAFNDVSMEQLKDQLVATDYTEQEYEQERQRLFWGFIAGRTYTQEYFEKLFLHHPLFNRLAQGLVFAQYRYGRAHNAFVVEGQQIKFVVSKPLEGDDISISILHPQDCDMRFQNAYNRFENPTFDQFDEVLYDVKNFSRSSVSVNIFAGMMIKPYEFAQKLAEFGFEINKEENSLVFDSFVFVHPTLKLVCELELEKPIQLSTPVMTLANLYFYSFSDALKVNGKWNTQKSNALGIGSLPYRYFGYVLTSIIKSVKATN
jgi:hypothetical protein